MGKSKPLIFTKIRNPIIERHVAQSAFFSGILFGLTLVLSYQSKFMFVENNCFEMFKTKSIISHWLGYQIIRIGKYPQFFESIKVVTFLMYTLLNSKFV